MFKNKKKVIYSLIVATLLSTTVANAAPYNYRNIDYNKTYNNYRWENTIIYNNNWNNNWNNNVNTEKETIKNDYPVFTWEVVVNTSPITRPGYIIDLPYTPPKPVQPTYPIPSEPVESEEPTYPSLPQPEKPVEPSVPEVPTVPASGLSAIEMELVRLVNIERQKGGLKPFTASSELSNVARTKSEDMARNNYFNHTSPTYGSPFKMMQTFGIKYSTAGENIARGQLSAQTVVNGWMNSSGHRANIMNPSFNKIGVGHSKSSNGTNYWTQMFTN